MSGEFGPRIPAGARPKSFFKHLTPAKILTRIAVEMALLYDPKDIDGMIDRAKQAGLDDIASILPILKEAEDHGFSELNELVANLRAGISKTAADFVQGADGAIGNQRAAAVEALHEILDRVNGSFVKLTVPPRKTDA